MNIRKEVEYKRPVDLHKAAPDLHQAAPVKCQ